MGSRFAAVACVVLWNLAATPTSAQLLQPTERWHADFGETQCVGARSFNSAAGPVTLGLLPSIGGQTYHLQVMVPQPGPAFAEEIRGTIDIGQGPKKTWMLHFGGQGAMSAYQATLSAAEVEQLRSATTLTIAPARGASYSFALAQMPAILDGLKECTAALQQHWNMTGSPTLSSAAAPAKEIRSLFKPGDYPKEAARLQQQGKVRYQLLVDSKGDIAGCHLVDSSGYPILDETGCEVIKEKAKFKPAADAQGKAVRSVFSTPEITWRLDTQAQTYGDADCINSTGYVGPRCGQSLTERTPMPTAPPPPPPKGN